MGFKGRYKYMHTMDKRPAFFYEDQIVYADIGSPRGYVESLCNSLAEIRRQQIKSFEYRKKLGFGNDSFEYDYVKVVIE